MNIKHNEIKIDDNDPFANCKLGRKKYSTVLTNIIKSYPNGFVLALNNRWGTGKTTFVKMWERDLRKEFKTVHFNAWENDFDNTPLTALMGELKTLTETATEPQFKKTLKNASSLVKHVAPVIVKAIVDKYVVDTKGINEAIVSLTEGLTDVFENEVNEYQKKKKSIHDFRKSLEDFIDKTNEGKPLIFIIDELDRCRPNYAVSVLEQIKHFFSVPNIVFILSIDKEQLGNAIKGVYGSADLDAEEYLRRFIDLEYSIPEPDTDIFYKHLYDYFEFDEFFVSNVRTKHKGDKSYFLGMCDLLFANAKVPLRQQEKIFAHSRLALRGFGLNNYVIPHVFLFLTFIKIRHNDFYEKMKSKSLSIREVQEQFYDLIKNKINEDTDREILWLEVNLVNVYNNYIQEKRYTRKPLYERDIDTGEFKTLFKSIVREGAEEDILSILKDINIGLKGPGNLDLSHFTHRIDLLEDIVT